MTAASNATHINCFVSESAYGKVGSRIQSRIEFLLEKNGTEWLASRGKAIYNAAQHLREGRKDLAVKIYQTNSIAYTRNGYPKDAFMIPVRDYVTSNRYSVIKKAAAVLRFYTAHTLPSLSPSQRDKCIRSITSPSTMSVSSMISTPIKMGIVMGRMGIDGFSYQRPQLISASNLSGFTATHTIDSNIPRDMLNIPYMNVVQSMSSSPYLPSCLKPLAPSWEIREYAERLNLERGLPIDICGKIHVIQEGGCKPRVVAIPNSWIQLMFTPVHQVFSDIAKGPLGRYSCMHDQTKGVHSVTRRLASGKTVSSVDLSSATDRFPLSLQTYVLRKVGMGPWSEGLYHISKGKWEFPQANMVVSYSAGQPMGMYGSFPLFHCSHAIFTLAVIDDFRKDHPSHVVETFDDETEFKVLGDDIVFADPTVAGYYIRHLQDIGVEISEHKTFLDSTFAEFAGFTAFPVKDDVLAFRPYKQPKENYVSNPIAFMETFYRPPYKGKRWDSIFNAYTRSRCERRLDQTPLFPELNLSTGPTQSVVESTIENASRTLYTYLSDRYSSVDGTHFRDIKVERPIVSEVPSKWGSGFTPITRRSEMKQREERIPHVVTSRSRAEDDPLVRSRVNKLLSSDNNPFSPLSNGKSLVLNPYRKIYLTPGLCKVLVDLNSQINHKAGSSELPVPETHGSVLVTDMESQVPGLSQSNIRRFVNKTLLRAAEYKVSPLFVTPLSNQDLDDISQIDLCHTKHSDGSPVQWDSDSSHILIRMKRCDSNGQMTDSYESYPFGGVCSDTSPPLVETHLQPGHEINSPSHDSEETIDRN
uniref:RNA-dependent RNA polymerase n=1 Tax=carmel mito-like virus TaxID=2858881 RepID=A0A8F5XS12_9VIRU|nr:RNA-dependent RNA polymerase [carmel mito-like virus]